jgi:copper chaperone CopZ
MTRFAVITAIAFGAAVLAGCGSRESAPAAAGQPGDQPAGRPGDHPGEQPAASVTETLKVAGMTCSGCEHSITTTVAKIDGVRDVRADHKAGQATVSYDPAKVDRAAIKVAIEKLGYKVEG